MAGKAIPVVRCIELGNIVSIDAETLSGMVAVDHNKNGVVLANERFKGKITLTEGEAPVEFTASIYIQRAPMDDDERDTVAGVKTEREAKAQDKADNERRQRERDIKAAFDMGQSSTLGALKNINELATAAGHLTRLAAK